MSFRRSKTPLQLRRVCQQALKNYDETMDYGMPVYKRDGVMEVSFASQKQYIALYVLKQDVVERHRSKLSTCEIKVQTLLRSASFV